MIVNEPVDCTKTIFEILSARDRVFPKTRDFMNADKECTSALVSLPPCCHSALVEMAESLVKGGGQHDSWEYELQILLRALFQVAHASTEALIASALSSDMTKDKITYITYLGELPGSHSITALADFALRKSPRTEEDEEAIAGAVRALRSLGATTKVDEIAPLLDSSSALVRSASIEFVSSSRSARSLEALKHRAGREANLGVLSALLEGLREYKSPIANDVIRSLSRRKVVLKNAQLREKFDEVLREVD